MFFIVGKLLYYSRLIAEKCILKKKKHLSSLQMYYFKTAFKIFEKVLLTNSQ